MKRVVAAVVATVMAVVVLAPAASAVNTGSGAENVAPPPDAEQGAVIGMGLSDSQGKAIGTPTPVKRGCKETGTCPSNATTVTEPPKIVTQVGGAHLFFWEGTTSITSPYGAFPADFDELYRQARCTAPKGFYDMPLGGKGPYTIGAGLKWYIDYIEEKRVVYVGSTPVGEESVYRTEFRGYDGTCDTYKTPALSTRVCLTYSETRLDGPFQRTGVADGGSRNMPAMLPFPDGTLTREPRTPGVKEVTGKTFGGAWTLGKTVGTPESRAKSTVPSYSNIYDICLDGTNTVSFTGTDYIKDYGRYLRYTTNWRTKVSFYQFGGAYGGYAKTMFPNTLSSPNYYSGKTKRILINNADPITTRDYIINGQAYCEKDSTPKGRFKLQWNTPADDDGYGNTTPAGAYNPYAEPPTPWTDTADPEFYSGECGNGVSKTPELDTWSVRSNDSLECDDYVVETRIPYTQVVKRQYLTDAWSRWFPSGGGGGHTNYWPGGTWRSCTYYPNPPWWMNGAHFGCSEGQYNNYWNYEYGPDTVNPPDPTCTSTGSDWLCSVPSPNIVVDNKRAAPIDRLTPDNRRGTNLNTTLPTGTPIHVQWRKPVINKRDKGRGDSANINLIDPNAKWTVEYRLTDGSSPRIIKGYNGAPAGPSDPRQPYHVFVDPSAATNTDGPLQTQKWTPTGVFNPAAVSAYPTQLNTVSTSHGISEGLEEKSRALNFRFFQAGNQGSTWELVPWWTVTATVNDTITQSTVTGLGPGGFTTSEITTTVPRIVSMSCPAEPFLTSVSKIQTNSYNFN